MRRGQEKQIYKTHIQVYSDVQKIINEVHYVLQRKHKVNPITFPPIKSEGKNINFTVELLGTDTSQIRTPLYYRQFPMSRQNSHIFSFKKTSVKRTLSSTDNGH